MASTAERMKAVRQRWRTRGLRELRMVIPDARDADFRRKVAEQVASLDPAGEEAAMRWIESVSIFDEDDAAG